METLIQAALRMAPALIADRRWLHANPEVGFELNQTSRYVARRLREMGVDCREISPSGLTATIGKGGRTLLLRADMDALPTQEKTDLPFRSKNGNGHLCGHDFHTAMLLGAASLMKAREAELKGVVKLMFQPAEELGAGAEAMIEAGVLENPRVDAALGMHVTPDLEPGKVVYKPGIAMSSLDVFRVQIQGVGGHSSEPHLCIDPLRIANAIYQALNTLTGTEVDPFEPAVLTIGKCGGGTAANIVPDTAVLEGGFRCFNPEVRERVVPKIHATIEAITATMGGHCTIEKSYTPAVRNDPALCGGMKPFIEEVIGKENLGVSERPISPTDDFAHLGSRVPSMFLQLGAGGLANFPLHNPNVLLDEAALPVGSALLANCAIQWLRLNS